MPRDSNRVPRAQPNNYSSPVLEEWKGRAPAGVVDRLVKESSVASTPDRQQPPQAGYQQVSPYQYYQQPNGNAHPPSNSSMSLYSPSTSTHSNEPALTQGSTAGTSSWGRTSEASLVSPRVLNSDPEVPDILNVPTGQPPRTRLPPTPVYPCIFGLLSCSERFNDPKTWATHVLSHFRALSPPSEAKCCFCNERFHSTSTAPAWSQYLNHLARHFLQGSSLNTARPDFALYQWMFQKGLINQQTYSRVQLVPPERNSFGSNNIRNSVGSTDEPVVVSSSQRNDRRSRARPGYGG